MESVHEVIVGIQIAVDEGHTAGGAGYHIQPPVGFRVLVGFHFVAKVTVQIGFRISGEFQPLFFQLFGQLGHTNGRLCLGRFQYIKAAYISHVGDFAQHLVGEGGEHPPGPAFCLPEHRQQFFTVGGDGEAVFALLLQPDLHILTGDVPAVIGAKADVSDGLAAHKDVPVLQHLLGGVLAEVHQLKQVDLVPLRGEDQLIFLAVEAHLEGNFVKNQIEGILHLGHEFCAAGVVFVIVHHLAQFCFHFGKGLPPVLCPLPEAGRKLRQSNETFTGINELLGIFVTRKFLQRLVEIRQCPALLIQIVIGIAHTEVPTVVFCKVVCMGFQQGKSLLIQFPILWNS